MSKEDAKSKKLHKLINTLPCPDISNTEIKELALRLIMEVPDDAEDSGNASRSKVKLEALRLLFDINKTTGDQGLQSELLDILASDAEDK